MKQLAPCPTVRLIIGPNLVLSLVLALVATLGPIAASASPGLNPDLTAKAHRDAKAVQMETAAEFPAKLLSEDQVRQEIDLLRKALTRIHPGTERFATKDQLAAEWTTLDHLAQNGTTDVDFYLAVQRLLATIRCDHTKAEIPQAWENWLGENATYLPFRLEFYGDRAFIAAADPQQPKIAVGSELIEIDGHSTKEILDAVRPLVAVDGYTDHIKNIELGYSSEYHGAAFDHFAQLVFGAKQTYRVTLRTPTGEKQTEPVKALTYPAWLSVATDGGHRYLNFKDEVEWRFIDDNTAYLRVGTFVNYREPVDPDETFRPLFAALNQRSTRRLIVDLRDNGGGSTEPTLSLLRYLMKEPFVWGRPSRMKFTDYGELKPFLSSWDNKILNPQRDWFIERDGWFELKSEQGNTAVNPHEEHFAGEVIVLIGPANSSGSTHLIAKLVDSGRVRTVGGKTGGNPLGATAGLLVFLKLPHSGITVRVPLQRIVLDVTQFADGQAIVPDVIVEPTPHDRLDPRDRVLEAALALEPLS